MILLDALFINNSGGKILLDYLAEKLHQSEKDVFFLLDQRVKGDFDYLPAEKVLYLPNSLLKRHRFYKVKGNRFSTVLCFANIPPSIRLKAKVYTYFHNTVLFYCADHFPLKEKVLYRAKSLVLRFFKKNTDKWIVQTREVARLLNYHWAFKRDSIIELPFFRSFESDMDVEQKDQKAYVLISDGHPNKMHHKLLEGFAIAQKQLPDIRLYLTISKQYPVLNRAIEDLKSGGVNVHNLGWCSPQKVNELYANCAFLVFPSIQESFGLGLIEAAQNHVKVLASDLPYVKAVIQATLLFDPHNAHEIAAAIVKSQNESLPPTTLRIRDSIQDLIQLLGEGLKI